MSHHNILFLCSGGGGNLRFIHHVIQESLLPGWSQIAVIADRECPAIEYARAASVTARCIDFTANEQGDLLDAVLELQPDIIITTVHKILRTPILEAFCGRLLNLHYSLLPAFGGTIGVRPVMAAQDYGVCLAGASVHLVDETVDGGKPVAQVAVPVSRRDNLAELMDVVFRAGCISLYAALRNIRAATNTNWKGQHISIKDRAALLNPGTELPPEFWDDDFWKMLRG
ncbi:MAG: hypothetical protein BMS9Abin33_0418 [Gammaproteobacteria bacterium]|nr:MAG: hypothetical protein BMS9Abin33_0418 [Gammaproteobacteria bacterium]